MEQIDLKEVIRKKDPSLAKKLPGFVIKLIERLIHLKEINIVLDKYRDAKGIDFVDGCLDYLNTTRDIQFANEEKINPKDKFIFVSNHPLGGLDGLVLTTEITKRFGPSKFIVNDILMNLEPLQEIFVPVNNLGTASNSSLMGLKELYNSDFHVLNFPSGACSRLINGKIQDLPWKKSFVREAIKSGRTIVPIYFGGKNSKLFYWTSKIRMALGIKAFIEMFLLPREMFRQRNNKFKVFIGEPITTEELTKSGKTAQEWCNIIRDRVYEYGKCYSTNK